MYVESDSGRERNEQRQRWIGTQRQREKVARGTGLVEKRKREKRENKEWQNAEIEIRWKEKQN